MLRTDRYSSKRKSRCCSMRQQSTKVFRQRCISAIFGKRPSSRASWDARKSERTNKRRYSFDSCAIQNMSDRISESYFVREKAKVRASLLKCFRSTNNLIIKEFKDFVRRSTSTDDEIDNLVDKQIQVIALHNDVLTVSKF